MEPAVERREHFGQLRDLLWDAQPQWSPPLRGGSTSRIASKAPTAMKAAMEPAVERREHLVVRFGSLAPLPAAMEPAVERREHPSRTRYAWSRR